MYDPTTDVSRRSIISTATSLLIDWYDQAGETVGVELVLSLFRCLIQAVLQTIRVRAGGDGYILP